MVNEIIRFLGGVTKEDFNFLNSQYISQRSHNEELRARVRFLEERNFELHDEKKAIQEILYRKVGLINSPEETSELSDLQPIQIGSTRWGKLKGKMERDDLMRVKSQGGTDAKIS